MSEKPKEIYFRQLTKLVKRKIKSRIETEVKVPVESPGKIRRLLKCMGFGIVRRRHFEKNELFDFANGRFRKKGVILRLRSIGKNYLLTFKGPLQSSRLHKTRNEIEMETNGGESLKEILKKSGLNPIFSYEKHRTLYSFVATKRGTRLGQIALDETPFGTFLELEGEPAWIDRTARKLGFSPKDYIKKSYPTLYDSNTGKLKKDQIDRLDDR